jgi:hypothetical protein
MQIEFIRSVGLEKGPSARNLKNATLGELLVVDVCKATYALGRAVGSGVGAELGG